VAPQVLSAPSEDGARRLFRGRKRKISALQSNALISRWELLLMPLSRIAGPAMPRT
jgi:hypothetical protein